LRSELLRKCFGYVSGGHCMVQKALRLRGFQSLSFSPTLANAAVRGIVRRCAAGGSACGRTAFGRRSRPKPAFAFGKSWRRAPPPPISRSYVGIAGIGYRFLTKEEAGGRSSGAPVRLRRASAKADMPACCFPAHFLLSRGAGRTPRV